MKAVCDKVAKFRCELEDKFVSMSPRQPHQFQLQIVASVVKNMVMGLSACIEDIVEIYLSGGRWQVLYLPPAY
jgi:hypothetical protein